MAEANPTDGSRMVTAWVCRKLGRPVNRKRVMHTDHYHHRPRSPLNHQTPSDVRQTWDDADQAQQKAAA